jgi:hypothetical protein
MINDSGGQHPALDRITRITPSMGASLLAPEGERL